MFAVVVFFVCYCAYSKVAGVTLSPVTIPIATASATATHWLMAKLSTDLKPHSGSTTEMVVPATPTVSPARELMPSFDASAFLMRFCEPLMVLVCFYSFTYTYDAFLYDGGTAWRLLRNSLPQRKPSPLRPIGFPNERKHDDGFEKWKCLLFLIRKIKDPGGGGGVDDPGGGNKYR